MHLSTGNEERYPYKISLTLDSAADTTPCPAGSGPFGSCKHISALCYTLEEFSRIKQLRSPDSQLQKWNQPRKRNPAMWTTTFVNMNLERARNK